LPRRLVCLGIRKGAITCEQRAPADRFDSVGLLAFDFKLDRRPEVPRDPTMAGYEACFKVVEKG